MTVMDFCSESVEQNSILRFTDPKIFDYPNHASNEHFQLVAHPSFQARINFLCVFFCGNLDPK